MKINTITAFFLILILSACNKATFSDSDRVIARAYDEYLYLSDIQNLVPPETSPSDSLAIVQNYVQNWVKNQILLRQAEKNLTTRQKDFSRQLEDYRNSLIIFEYESELIRQKLDTALTRSEIEDYYNNYADNFRLNENIVRVVYAKVNQRSPYRDKIRELVESDREADRDSLEFYCIRYAADYGLIDRNWITFDEMLNRVPVPVENPEVFLNKNRFVRHREDTTWYYAQILDYSLKDEVSPLSLEEQNIRSIILNKRKKMLISKMHQEMYDQAMTENNFEFY
mgnify:CR=1 FL=1